MLMCQSFPIIFCLFVNDVWFNYLYIRTCIRKAMVSNGWRSVDLLFVWKWSESPWILPQVNPTEQPTGVWPVALSTDCAGGWGARRQLAAYIASSSWQALQLTALTSSCQVLKECRIYGHSVSVNQVQHSLVVHSWLWKWMLMNVLWEEILFMSRCSLIFFFPLVGNDVCFNYLFLWTCIRKAMESNGWLSFWVFVLWLVLLKIVVKIMFSLWFVNLYKIHSFCI